MNHYYNNTYPHCPHQHRSAQYIHRDAPTHNDLTIYFKSSDNILIEFPAYLKEVSRTAKNLLGGSDAPYMPLPYSFNTLDKLVALIRVLPSPRNTRTATIPINEATNIYQVTEDTNPDTVNILVNSEVYNAVFPILSRHHFTKREVEDIYRVVNYLDIPSLLNAVPRFIASTMYDPVQREQERLRALPEHANDAPIKLLLDATRNVTGQLYADELVVRITKYIFLQSIGVAEQNIADYIGMNGIPDVEPGKLDLSSKGITGLSGMELISNDEALTANLSHNSILGNSLDLNFPPRPFRGLGNLQWLYINNNHLTTLPEGVFSGLRNLHWLFLDNNRLTTLPKGVFNGLRNLHLLRLYNNYLITLPDSVFSGLENLSWLSLRNNQLTTLPEGVFSGLGNLRRLSLDNNHLTTLPERVFRGSRKLSWLSLNDNKITTLPKVVFSGLGQLHELYLYNNRLSGTEAEFRNTHSIPNHIILEFNPQQTPLSASMKYSSRYSNLYACFWEPVSPRFRIKR